MSTARRLLGALLGRRLPVTSGTLHVSGLQAPLTIRRDEHGIAYVDAESDADAWYGLGFCHGQDRAFQLESLLRIVRGTLSAVAGPAGLAVDRLARRIGFHRAAEQQLRALDAEAQAMLAAYARGTYAGATRGCPHVAHEFALLFARPTPYTAADVLGIVKFLSFNLASNWDAELARLLVLAQDGEDAVRALDTPYPEWHPVTAPPATLAGPAAERLAADLAAFAATLLTAAGRGGGSNNWVIAPQRTATGRPILANDPHLAALLPPFWYLAHVRTPEWAIAGASFAGAPVFPAGHNGTAAWGMTAGFVDNTDLFVEELGPDGRSVRQGTDFVPCEVAREVIHVRGHRVPVVEEVLVTPRGPIVTPALQGAENAGALSMRATWLDPRPAGGLLCLHRVRSFGDFRRAFARWPAISLNLVYADTSGAIGWQLVGDAPQRRKGYGTLPLPGWDPDAGWEDECVPFETLPHAADPACGFLATANNQPVQDADGPFLGHGWLDGYRVARIGAMLAARDDWDVPATQALQMDRHALPWQELRDTVLAVPAPDADTRRALDLLGAWDGEVAPDSPAATVYESFLIEMQARIVLARAPKAGAWLRGKSPIPILSHTMLAERRAGHLVRLLRSRPPGWFARPWPDEIAEALAACVRGLRARCGADPAHWAWGRVRPLTLRHLVGAETPLRRAFNLGPFPCGGDTDTVNHASVEPFDLAAGAGSIPSLRMVLDVGDWDAGRFALPGGNSGNPCSPHYADLLPYWQRGDGVPVAWSAEAVAQAARSTLRLMR